MNDAEHHRFEKPRADADDAAARYAPSKSVANFGREMDW